MRLLLTGFWLLWIVVQVVAQSPKNPIEPVTSTAQSAGTLGKTYAIIVGISKYQYVDKLDFAAKDALAFYDFLRSPAGSNTPESQLTLLCDSAATYRNITVGLATLISIVKPNDRIFLFFSCHGGNETITTDKMGYLYTYDCDKANPSIGGFPISYLESIVRTFTEKTTEVYVIIDACRSGNVVDAETNRKLTNAQLAKKFANEFKFLSCQSGQYSYEGIQWGGGHGVFSYHLIRGLQGLSDGYGSNNDSEKDGVISLKEIGRYLEDYVSKESKPNTQRPLIMGDAEKVVASVHPPTLQSLKANFPLPTFTSIKGKGFVEDILEKAGGEAQQRYKEFYSLLNKRRDVLINGVRMNSVDGLEIWYGQLREMPGLTPLLPFIRRDIAAALIEDSQRILQQYLRGQSLTLTNVFCQETAYRLDYASDILGPSHYLNSHLKARSLFFQALEKSFSPNPNASISLLQKALTLDSTSAYIYYELGKKFYKIGADSVAIKTFEKGIEYAPNWAYLRNDLGIVLYKSKKYSEAIPMFLRAIKIDPKYDAAYNNLGMAYLDQQICHLAIEAFQKAYDLSPENELYLFNLGRAFLANGSLDAAIAVFRKSLKINPKNAEVYFEVGKIWELKGQKESAIRAYQTASEYNTRSSIPPITLAKILGEMGKKDEAFQWLQKGLQRGYADWPSIMTEKAWEEVRQLPAFQELMQKYKK